jgi:hypothetical protein
VTIELILQCESAAKKETLDQGIYERLIIHDKVADAWLLESSMHSEMELVLLQRHPPWHGEGWYNYPTLSRCGLVRGIRHVGLWVESESRITRLIVCNY